MTGLVGTEPGSDPLNTRLLTAAPDRGPLAPCPPAWQGAWPMSGTTHTCPREPLSVAEPHLPTLTACLREEGHLQGKPLALPGCLTLSHSPIPSGTWGGHPLVRAELSKGGLKQQLPSGGAGPGDRPPPRTDPVLRARPRCEPPRLPPFSVSTEDMCARVCLCICVHPRVFVSCSLLASDLLFLPLLRPHLIITWSIENCFVRETN